MKNTTFLLAFLLFIAAASAQPCNKLTRDAKNPDKYHIAFIAPAGTTQVNVYVVDEKLVYTWVKSLQVTPGKPKNTLFFTYSKKWFLGKKRYAKPGKYRLCIGKFYNESFVKA